MFLSFKMWMDIKSKIKFVCNYLKEKWLRNLLLLLFLKFKNHRVKLARKYIKWNWIEIWAGGNPLRVNKKIAKVKYVDYLPNKNLQEINEAFKKYKTVNIDYVCDANDLSSLGKNSQDFIIANHVFEHLKNPLKSLQSRYSILKNNWIVFLTVPDKRKTFDKHRDITLLNHIVDDYKDPSEKRDFEHFIEFAQISLTEKFNKESFSNNEIENEAKRLFDINYSIHYHVFLRDTVEEIIHFWNEENLFHFDIIASKNTTRNPVDNEFILVLKKY